MDPREELDRIEQTHTFKVPVADRLKRLPPYLFGKINDLTLKDYLNRIDKIRRSIVRHSEYGPRAYYEFIRDYV